LLLFCIHLRKTASAHRLKCRNKNGNLAKSCTDKEKGTVRDADQCPVRRASDIAAVNGGDTAGSIYRFNGTDWEILVKNGKNVLPNAVVDKINQSIVLQKIEFGSNKWTKNGTDDYQLVLEVPNAEVLKVIIYDGQVKKTSTITAEYTDTQILLRSVYPERGYVLYFNSNTSNVIEYGDTV